MPAAAAGRMLGIFADRATLLLASGVFFGLLWPALAHALRPALVPSVFIIVALALARLDWRALADYGRRPFFSAAVLAWLMLACPALTALAVAALPLPPALATALTLAAMSAPIFASVAFTLLLRLDSPLAVVASVLSTFLVPLTLPPMALALLGLDLSVGVTEFALRLGGFIGGATAAAMLLRAVAGRARIDRHARRIDGFAVLCFIVFATAIMDGVRATLLARPGFVLLSVAAAFAINLALQAVGTAAFWRAGRAQALTVGLLSGNRNLALLLAVLVDRAEFDVLLFFAAGQFPIFVLPAVLAPLYRRLARGAPP